MLPRPPLLFGASLLLLFCAGGCALSTLISRRDAVRCRCLDFCSPVVTGGATLPDRQAPLAAHLLGVGGACLGRRLIGLLVRLLIARLSPKRTIPVVTRRITIVVHVWWWRRWLHVARRLRSCLGRRLIGLLVRLLIARLPSKRTITVIGLCAVPVVVGAR